MKAILRKLSIGILAAGAVVAPAVPASAVEPVWTEWATFPAGVACEFPLRLDTAGAGQRNEHTVYDKDGDVIVILSTGTGVNIKYTNVDSGDSITTRSNGAVTRMTKNDDGAMVLLGHNVLVMFPTDVPPGPSTVVYSGQVKLVLDEQGNTVVVKEAGKQLDVCAAITDVG